MLKVASRFYLLPMNYTANLILNKKKAASYLCLPLTGDVSTTVKLSHLNEVRAMSLTLTA